MWQLSTSKAGGDNKNRAWKSAISDHLNALANLGWYKNTLSITEVSRRILHYLLWLKCHRTCWSQGQREPPLAFLSMCESLP